MLDKGADVNAKFRYGATALFKAAERGHTEVVKLLIERGADVNVKDTFYGATALYWAMQKGHTGVVRAILAKSAEDAGDVLLDGRALGQRRDGLGRAGDRQGARRDADGRARRGGLRREEGRHRRDCSRRRARSRRPRWTPATLQSYVGKYKGDPGPEISIELKDGKLVGAGGGGRPLTLFPLDQTTFRPAEFDGLTFTFKVEAGKVTGIDFKQGPNTRR